MKSASRNLSWKPGRLTVFLGIFTAGCIDPVSTVPVVTWQGLLEPLPGSSVSVSGSVAMVANQFSTQIGVGVSAGPENTSLRWVVRTGTCASPGTSVTGEDLFPALSLDDSGTGEAELVLNRRINVSGTFAAQVLDLGGQSLACADLARQD